MVWLGREGVMGILESLSKSPGLKDILQAPPKLVQVLLLPIPHTMEQRIVLLPRERRGGGEG